MGDAFWEGFWLWSSLTILDGSLCSRCDYWSFIVCFVIRFVLYCLLYRWWVVGCSKIKSRKKWIGWSIFLEVKLYPKWKNWTECSARKTTNMNRIMNRFNSNNLNSSWHITNLIFRAIIMNGRKRWNICTRVWTRTRRSSKSYMNSCKVSRI